jgi:hypothetical protein
MIRMKLMSAGLLSVALLATPAMAQEATQEPGVMGYNYPNSAYLTGGYGHSFKPRPLDYYYGYARRWPSMRTAPEGYYGYYGPYPAPRVGAFATAPWVDDSYGYYGYVAPY